MNDDPIALDPTQAIPWYKSRVLVGLVTIVVSQVVDQVQKHYKINLGAFGISINDLVDYILDGVGVAAASWVAHARVTKPSPPVTLTKAAAVAANSIPTLSKDPTT